MKFTLTPQFIEFIHDVLVAAFLRFDEPVSPQDYRDKALIESAIARPFQSAFGEEIWQTMPEKAAALFHSLTCNHCFLNGNKRTAVMALEFFLQANGFLLAMTQIDIYELARTTASANERSVQLDELLSSLSLRLATDMIAGNSFGSEEAQGRLRPSVLRIAAMGFGLATIPKIYGIETVALVD